MKIRVNINAFFSQIGKYVWGKKANILKRLATNYLRISVICLSRANGTFSVTAEIDIILSVRITKIIYVRYRGRKLEGRII